MRPPLPLLPSDHVRDPGSVLKVSSVEHSGLRSQRIVTCQQPIEMNRLRVALCYQCWTGLGEGRAQGSRAKSGARLNLAERVTP